MSARVKGTNITLVACFELEERPPWLVSVGGSDELCVDLDVSSADLVVASGALRADLARFPQRGDDRIENGCISGATHYSSPYRTTA